MGCLALFAIDEVRCGVAHQPPTGGWPEDPGLLWHSGQGYASSSPRLLHVWQGRK